MSRDLFAVADVHLGENDPDLDDFCAFLAARAEDASVVVLLGDIFSLWLGREKFTLPHQRRVLDVCAALRAQGVRIVFIEGNREFMTREWQGRAFDEVALAVTEAPWAGKRWYLAHGDLLNPEDRRGAAFRAFVRSSLVLRLFGMLPSRAGLALAARLERALRHRNMRHKTAIPRSRFESYAQWLAGHGFDAGAIGHIHVELALSLGAADGRERLLCVLPDWRTARRYLRVPPAGPPRFEAWGVPRPDPPTIVEVDESREHLRVVLDAPVDASVGARVAVSSGHGPEVRRGLVIASPAQDGTRLEMRLEPGPPARVGDRVLGIERRRR